MKKAIIAALWLMASAATAQHFNDAAAMSTAASPYEEDFPFGGAAVIWIDGTWGSATATITVAKGPNGPWLSPTAAGSATDCGPFTDDGACQFTMGPGSVRIALSGGTGDLIFARLLPSSSAARATTGAATQLAAGDSDLTIADAGAGTLVATMDGGEVWTTNAGGLTIGGTDATDRLVLPLSNDAVTPTLAFGDGDTGLYESSDDQLTASFAGVAGYIVDATSIRTTGVAGNPQMLREVCSGTNPVWTVSSSTSGLGCGDTNSPSVVGGGVEVTRFNTLASGVNFLDFTPGIATNGPIMAADGTDTNIDLLLTGKGTGGVSASGCVSFGKLSAAPTGAACDVYWDTDLNISCSFNGTNWVQNDDWSTVCA